VNLYAYAGNSPISFRDPFGLCADDPPDTITVTVRVWCGGNRYEMQDVTATRVKDPKELANLAKRAGQLQGGTASYPAADVSDALRTAVSSGGVYVFSSTTADGGLVMTGGETVGPYVSFRANVWSNIQMGASFMNRQVDPRITGSACQDMGHEGVHLIQHSLGFPTDENTRENLAVVIQWHCR
jgi:hypothetical protein